MIDTGATAVVLSPTDAERLGYDLAKLGFTGFAQTANGTVRTAPIRLDSLVVGDIRLTDLPAVVNQAAMAGSLLGMSFLDRPFGPTRSGTACWSCAGSGRAGRTRS